MIIPLFRLLGASLGAAVFILTGFAEPALSACIKKNPLFGFDVYVEDKYCPKIAPKKNKRIKAARPKRATPQKTIKKAKLPDANSDVRKMQVLLTELGYKPGPVDGVQGPATNKALSNFQDTMGVTSSTSMANNLVLLHRLAGK